MHKGRVMKEWPKFSRGTRQHMAKLAEDNKWWEEHKIFIGEVSPPEFKDTSYSELLASSVFCVVLQGDGWSSRFEDGISHGGLILGFCF